MDAATRDGGGGRNRTKTKPGRGTLIIIKTIIFTNGD